MFRNSLVRFVLEWEISRRVDDARPLGFWLSWIVRHDSRSREFYEELLSLDGPLSRDAEALLRESSRKRIDPLKCLNRSLPVFASGESRLSRKRRKSFVGWTVLTVLLVAIFSVLPGWLLMGSAVAETPKSNSGKLITASVQSDPQVYAELVQLCQSQPNDAGPFFVNSNSY